MDAMIQRLAQELERPAHQVENVVHLIDEGNTIPFIARYRKELHGSMDDQLLRQLAERLQYLRNLEARKEEVRSAIEGQGKLNCRLKSALAAAETLAEVEDLYRPYKPKRRTRATIAREKGLAPLAELLSARGGAPVVPEEAAQAYVDPEKGVETIQDALQGASDILAEQISDDAVVRKKLRQQYLKRAMLVSKAADAEPKDSVYRLYYGFKCPVGKVQGYQTLAINRGEREGFLKVSVELDPESAHVTVRRAAVPGRACMDFVRAAADDAYDRLIQPSMEREIRSYLTDQADEGAIHMFALNLKPLLMQPPVKGKVTMGLDPGYRMGCKVAVVDGTGRVLDTVVVYPTHGKRQKEEAVETLSKLVRKYGVEHIAIGNGTASRETEQMTVELIHRLGGNLRYMIVNEAGASVYSASQLAAEEFPQFDVNLRSAVSIARRLQDPLAELVKIDPKAIGVGQYQHDMPQARLDETLSGVVEDCVNAVGVDLNTASAPLLLRVSGLNNTTAKNIVKYREENGAFTARKQLLKVPKLGPKAFEQCAGFREQKRAGQHRRPPGELRRRRKAPRPVRLRPRRREGGDPHRPPGPGGGLRRSSSRRGLRSGRPHPPGRGGRAHEAGPGPPGRAPEAHPPHRRAGDEGLKARHGAHRHRPQRHRLRRLCGHRRPPGRPGPHLPAEHPPPGESPLPGLRRGGRGHRLGAGGGREEEAHQPHHEKAQGPDCVRRFCHEHAQLR